jgi:hypothetical protein
MMKGFDCAAIVTTSHAKAMHALGYRFAMRYWYNLTVAEIERLHAAGLAVGLIFEGGAEAVKPAYYTAERGAVHVNAAVRKAQALGWPRGKTIWYAVDADVPAELMLRLDDYGARTMGPTTTAGYVAGVYGSGAVLSALLAANHAERAWLAGATAWRGSRDFAGWHMRQTRMQHSPIHGLYVDDDECPDLEAAGLWLPPSTTP